MEDGVYHHTDGSLCDSRRIVDFVPLHKQVILVCGHNLLVFKEPSRDEQRKNPSRGGAGSFHR